MVLSSLVCATQYKKLNDVDYKSCWMGWIGPYQLIALWFLTIYWRMKQHYNGTKLHQNDFWSVKWIDGDNRLKSSAVCHRVCSSHLHELCSIGQQSMDTKLLQCKKYVANLVKFWWPFENINLQNMFPLLIQDFTVLFLTNVTFILFPLTVRLFAKLEKRARHVGL